MNQDNNNQVLNVDGLNTDYTRHTRKTGNKVINAIREKDPDLQKKFTHPNKDKSIWYEHESVSQTFHIDISKLTSQQIIDMVADTAIILQQKNERALSIESMQKRTDVIIDVAELLNNKKVSASPEQNIEKNFDKLSPDARIALLKKLGAEV